MGKVNIFDTRVVRGKVPELGEHLVGGRNTRGDSGAKERGRTMTRGKENRKAQSGVSTHD